VALAGERSLCVVLPHETFVLRVHDDGSMLVENARTHDSVWLREPSQVAEEIARWLEPADEPCDQSPTAAEEEP
jgi:hypothetical protein